MKAKEESKTCHQRDPLRGCPPATGASTAASATEVFDYDELQRLKSGSRSWNGAATTEADGYAFDVLGNITQKSDYGSTYAYGDSTRTRNMAGPHVVLSVQKKDSLASFSYDANGNLVQGDGRTVAFDSADRPVHVAMGAVTSDFFYAPDGARYAQRETGSPEGARTIYYVGKDFERVYWDDGRIEERSYVGPSVVVYRQGAGAPEVRYRHGDRLNSLDAATDSSGKEMPADLHGYDAFGKPRGYDWHANPGGAFERLHASEFGVTTNNGFTTHEHLDEVYLIHMNGRVYDYRLGRFLSVDPIISNPANSQSINPYSYIGNNPLSGVDPTGYCDTPTGTHVCGTPAESIAGLSVNGNPAVSGSNTFLGAVKDYLKQVTNGSKPDNGNNPAISDKEGPSDTAKGPSIEGLKDWFTNRRAEWKQDFEDAFKSFTDSLNPRRLTRNEVEAELGRDTAQKAAAMGTRMGGDAYDATETVVETAAETWGLGKAVGLLGGLLGKAVKGPFWTSTKNKTPVENAYRHFKDHGAEFGSKNSVDYVKSTQEFLRNPPAGTLSKTRANGDIIRYHPNTNTFGVIDAAGAPRTMFKPDPAVHGKPSNLDYFHAQ